MIIKKKGVKWEDEKDSRISSMIVGQQGEDKGQQEDGDSDVEDTLYNLMRGHSSLMIAADPEISDSESEGEREEENSREIRKGITRRFRRQRSAIQLNEGTHLSDDCSYF